MSGRSGELKITIAALALVLVAGCSVNSTFIYKPSEPATDVQKLPVKVAVLPFVDGTREYTINGSSLGGYVNLAKTGIDYGISAFTPNRWGKAFADELSASGCFHAVRFVSDISQVVNDEVVVAGTVTNADVPILGGSDPVRFAVSLNARVGRDGKAFWEKALSKDEALGGGYSLGCGLNRQCAIDRRHSHHNDLLRVMYLEARQDLVASLASDRGDKNERFDKNGSHGSVDETIEFILKDK
jgi:hypothetical protein